MNSCHNYKKIKGRVGLDFNDVPKTEAPLLLGKGKVAVVASAASVIILQVFTHSIFLDQPRRT